MSIHWPTVVIYPKPCGFTDPKNSTNVLTYDNHSFPVDGKAGAATITSTTNGTSFTLSLAFNPLLWVPIPMKTYIQFQIFQTATTYNQWLSSSGLGTNCDRANDGMRFSVQWQGLYYFDATNSFGSVVFSTDGQKVTIVMPFAVAPMPYWCAIL